MKQAIYKSPLGWLKLSEEDGFLMKVEYCETEPTGEMGMTSVLQKTMLQLDEYFDGKRRIFDIPIHLKGTAFRQQVWNQLRRIPYGSTCTYSEVAMVLGQASASRAVGQANHHNPINIIVPCHRVIGSSGKLTGYGGGLWRKEWLLEFEKKNK